MTRPAIVGGLDIGGYADHSALSVLSRQDGIDGDLWRIEAVHKLPLIRSAKEQVEILQPLVGQLDALAYDCGGVGQNFIEHMDTANLQYLVPVVIVGGSSEPHIHKGRVVVSKRRLIGSLQSMLAMRELDIADNAPGRDELRNEMVNFIRVPSGRHTKMEAKQGAHDDCLLSLSIATLLCRRV
ncbi:hypothetical protein [Ruegeria arenilitoris]|uniref:hypothetical protein n=1 Tax=Ruegeria arenilitoris TaxID=1173585 RepID=UPI001479F2FD|nr:hypothetical protein [Ruegeria arenilitoris]